MRYQDENSKLIDKWCQDGWKWGIKIDHETYLKALNGEYELYLTPTKPVPSSWLDVKGKKVLGLASGGGQQIPILNALGAKCTLLDFSKSQCQSDLDVAKREGYEVEVICADMTKPLPFKDESFDLIVNPVSNCFIKEVGPLFKECYRILKKGGELIGGYDIGVGYAFDDDGEMCFVLPYDPLNDPDHQKAALENDWGYDFSHSIQEQIGGQLKAGFTLIDIYDDTSGYGKLEEYKIPTFIATRSKKI